MGPTASGKTELAVKLVQTLPCEIISVDSAMIYRGLDIGAAKPGPDILALAPHRLLDILDPAESYSAARFRADALEAMREITAAGRIPLLVGGTGLYFRALQQGLSQLPGADPAVRARLERDAAEQGWPALHRRLQTVDPVAAARVHPHDPQRIQRALEVYLLTGQALSVLQQNTAHSPLPYRVCKLILAPGNREILKQRIDQRFRQMLEQGLLQETRDLFARPDLNPGLPAIRCVGYRQVWQYLAGEVDYREMVRRAVTATRQLAKRQLTWLRSESDAHWFDSLEPGLTEKVLARLRDSRCFPRRREAG